MAGSAFEDQTVTDIDVSSLSDEELQDIVDNDERSTLVDQAKSEQASRASDDESAATSDEEPVAGDKAISVTSLNSPDDPVERARALGLNADGINADLDAGQLQVQDYFDAVEVSGVIPPTGGPPSDALTVEKVVEREQADKEAARAAREEELSSK